MKRFPIHLQILGSFLTLQAVVLAATIGVVNQLYTRMLEAQTRSQLRVTKGALEFLLQLGRDTLPGKLELTMNNPSAGAYRQAARENAVFRKVSLMVLKGQLGSAVLLTDPAGLVTDSTLDAVPEGTPLGGLHVVGEALQGRSGMELEAVAGRAYMMVACRRPVGGAVVLPTPLGGDTAATLQGLTGAGFSFEADGRVVASTLDAPALDDLRAALPGPADGGPRLIGAPGRRQLVMSARVSKEVVIHLHRGWDEALLPLAMLRRRLLVIGLSGIALTAVAGWLIAKGVTSTLQRLVDGLNRLNDLKSKFFLMVAHDVRGPLTAVFSGSEQLCAEPLAEKPARLAGMVHRAATSLDFLVSDLEDFAAIEAGKLRMDPRPMDLSAVVADLAERMQVIARERGVGLRVLGLPGSLPITGDPKRLEQMLQNLCANAIHYTRPGGEVTLEVARDARTARMTVRDTGIGISPEDQRRVFEPFFQTKDGRTVRSGGFGIGLTIVREIAEAHGGRVSVESAPGKGSAFSVTLPAGEGAP